MLCSTGEKGYADTSLEAIAADCGLTIRPIYHYFGNEKDLFSKHRVKSRPHSTSYRWMALITDLPGVVGRQVDKLDVSDAGGLPR